MPRVSPSWPSGARPAWPCCEAALSRQCSPRARSPRWASPRSSYSCTADLVLGCVLLAGGAMSLNRWLGAWALVVVVLFSALPAAAQKRVVVMDFDGPMSSQVRAQVVGAL